MNVYIYQADVWCEDCGAVVCDRLRVEGKAPADPEDECTYDSDDYPKGPFEDEESDCPEHCAGCGVFLENPLTKEGFDHLKGSIVDAVMTGATDSVALSVWAPYYGVPVGPLEPDRSDAACGAYWAYADYHAGQDSQSYQWLSAVSKIYRPGPREYEPTRENALGYYIKFAVRASRSQTRRTK